MIGAQFKRNLIIAMPYTIHAVLTNNGIRSHQPCSPKICSRHVFDRACDQNGAVHRLTTVKHPWVNGQIDPMNRTTQLATVKRYHYDTTTSFDSTSVPSSQLTAEVRLKTLKGLTPHGATCKAWQNEPARFTSNLHHQTPDPDHTPQPFSFPRPSPREKGEMRVGRSVTRWFGSTSRHRR